MRRAILSLLFALFAPLALATQTLEVIVFPGGFNWPLWVGMLL